MFKHMLKLINMETIKYNNHGNVINIEATFKTLSSKTVTTYNCVMEDDGSYKISECVDSECNDNYLRFCVGMFNSDFTITDFCIDLTSSLGVNNNSDDILYEFKTLFTKSDGIFEEKIKNTILKLVEEIF